MNALNATRSLPLVLAFAALWAAEEAVTGLVMGRLPPVQVIWSRFALHLLMLVLWSGRRPMASIWRTRRPGLQFVRSLALLGMPTCWLLAMHHGVDADTLLAVFWLSPLLIPVFAVVLLREQVQWPLWAAAAAAVAGAAALIGPDRMELPPMHLLVFPIGMAASFSLYVVMTRMLRGEPTRANLFHAALGVFVMLTPFVPATWVTPTLREWLLLTGVAALGLAGLFVMERLAGSGPIAPLAPLLGVELAFALGFASVGGHGELGSNVVVGLLIIGATAWFAWLRHWRAVPVAAVAMETQS